jgi:four helix bundle protein
LNRPAIRKNFRLKDQIRDTLDSIASNIAEGFAQSTDKAFATIQALSAFSCQLSASSQIRF